MIGYVLSDVRFDWLVGDIHEHVLYQENLFQSRSKKGLEIFYIKAIEDFFLCFHSLIYTLGGVGRILDSYANPRLRLRFA